MTKTEVIRSLAEKENLSITDSKIILNLVFSHITELITQGEQVTIDNFGTFSSKLVTVENNIFKKNHKGTYTKIQFKAAVKLKVQTHCQNKQK